MFFSAVLKPTSWSVDSLHVLLILESFEVKQPAQYDDGMMMDLSLAIPVHFVATAVALVWIHRLETMQQVRSDIAFAVI